MESSRAERSANATSPPIRGCASRARAAVAALEWLNGVVNIVDDEPAPSHEWLPALATAFGEPAPAIVPGRAPWERGASNHKARTELAWTPEWPTWRTGFAAA